MFNAPRKKTAAVLVCAVLFSLGLAKLFLLRFEAGDFYPVYSSLRGDPLGTQVLYESLNRMRANSAQRNYRPLNQVKMAGDQTWMVIGLPGQSVFLEDKVWEEQLDHIARSGARLVVTFTNSTRRQPSQGNRRPAAEDEEELETPVDPAADAGLQTPTGEASEKDEVCPSSNAEETIETLFAWPGLLGKLGAKITPSKVKILDTVAERTGIAPEALPPAIPWRSPFCIVLEDPQWQPLYRAAGEPVVAVRPWGAGSVVIASDSYLFSNEALRSDRFSGLLSWFIQPPHRVVIDEFHNGLVKKVGIADLMRKYRLYGVLASLTLLLVLLMWRQTAVFAAQPAEHGRAAHDIDAGSDTAEGLVNLMQQHIRADKLLGVCFSAWQSTAAAGRVPPERMVRLKRIVDDVGATPRQKSIVTAYQQICELLRQGKIS